MNETQLAEIDLDLEQLETGALALVLAISSSAGKQGNRLMKRLSAPFGEEYAIRTGKLTLLQCHQFDFNFEEYSVDDLNKGFIHFAALSVAFEQNGNGSSSKFCKQLLACIL